MTLLEIISQVKDDLDLNEEDWVLDSDLIRWTNEAIKDAEASIHTIYEDYFLCYSDPIAISENSNLVDYPADIYANKIRKIIFEDGLGGTTASHEVKHLKNIMKGIDADVFVNNSTNPVLSWAPVNNASTGKKIRLFPKTGRNGFLTIWYIRNANRLVNNTDETDIEEFEHYIVQYVKTKVYLKDGDPRADDSKILQAEYKADMIRTLTNMVPDNEDELEMDNSFYDDMGIC